MFDTIIKKSLEHRALVLLFAALITAFALLRIDELSIDVFPDLNRPTVTVMIEAPGMAPQEVETQVVFPLETALLGAPGVERVRSSSGVGLGVVWIEFDWDTDIRYDRQVVQERLDTVRESLPEGVHPIMTPIASLMGEILLIGLREGAAGSADPMELRTFAEWTLRPRLLAVPGVAQVTVLGGELKQYQVLADLERLRRFSITMEDLESALRSANENTGGGIVRRGDQELLVRNVGRITDLESLRNSPVSLRAGAPILVRDVAEVELGAAQKRGDGSVDAKPAVILAVQKQPDAPTLELTRQIDEALVAMQPNLPRGASLNAELFRQATFIGEAVKNVGTALRDGAILVAIVLLAFLLNVRTTIITLVAIPLSIVVTSLVFEFLGLSINTMTLGGLAVAIGELVDDAIVDVENVLRRLRENAASSSPRSSIAVVFDASREIRNSIVFGTAVVLLVFLPLFALESIEGRLFQPLAIAYVTSILASLAVSLTVTPALASLLLGRTATLAERGDGIVLRGAKAIARGGYALTFPRPRIVCAVLVALLVLSGFLISTLGRDFLPPFDEGTATINLTAQPSIALEESNRIGNLAEQALLQIPDVKSTGRRTGRAEQDEHAEGVHVSEIDVDFWSAEQVERGAAAATPTGRVPPAQIRERAEVLADIRARLAELPHVSANVGQPISHRLDHLLSGVRAQVAIKIIGEDLLELRRIGREIETAISEVPGVVDLQLESQVMVPTLQLSVDRARAARYGFAPKELADAFATAMQGRVLSVVFEERGRFDLVLWSLAEDRRDEDAVRSMRLVSRTGAEVVLADVADVEVVPGPNQVNRENGERRFVVGLNIADRDLGSAVKEIQERIDVAVRPHLGTGYRIEYGGQFESEARASRHLLWLGSIALLGMFALLYAHFRSFALVVQIMLNIPFAFVGSAFALWIAGETLTVASVVGFISLAGISARNGILMIAHYMHLMVQERLPFGPELVVRGSQERVAPVAMTALTSALALLPLALAQGEPGKEILHPVALVVLGGLVTSTLLDFLVTPTVFLNWSGRAAAAAAAQQRANMEEQVTS